MIKDKECKTTMVIREDLLSELIDCAMSDNCGFAWWKSSTQESEAKAVAELKAEGNDDPCRSEVFARILLNGGKIKLLDSESDWHWSGHKEGEMLWNCQILEEGCEPVGGDWKSIGLKDVVEGIRKYGEENVANACGPSLKNIVDNGDFYDADAVFQYAAYGEVIYG